jgi:hypothetical protein
VLPRLLTTYATANGTPSLRLEVSDGRLYCPDVLPLVFHSSQPQVSELLFWRAVNPPRLQHGLTRCDTSLLSLCTLATSAVRHSVPHTLAPDETESVAAQLLYLVTLLQMVPPALRVSGERLYCPDVLPVKYLLLQLGI